MASTAATAKTAQPLDPRFPKGRFHIAKAKAPTGGSVCARISPTVISASMRRPQARCSPR